MKVDPGKEVGAGVVLFPAPKGGGSIESPKCGWTTLEVDWFPAPKGGGSIEGVGQGVKERVFVLFPAPKGGGSIEGR